MPRPTSTRSGSTPDDAEARVRRGRLHAALRDFARAIADFDRAIALGRRDADLYRDRGDARAAVGDEAGAKADRDRADRLREPIAPPGDASSRPGGPETRRAESACGWLRLRQGATTA